MRLPQKLKHRKSWKKNPGKKCINLKCHRHNKNSNTYIIYFLTFPLLLLLPLPLPRKFALLRLMKEYFVDDVKAMAVGSNKETDSFLTKDDDEEDELEEEMTEAVKETREDVLNIGKPRVAILNRRSTISSVVNLKRRIEDDIAFDKTLSLDELKIPEGALARSQTTGKAFGEAYQMATLSAMQKHKTRIVRRRSTSVRIPESTSVRIPDIAVVAAGAGEEQSAA